MLKAAGLIMIVAAGAGLGLNKSVELTKRAEAIRMLLRLIGLLKGEIRCTNAPLTDAFAAAGRKLSGEYGAFLRAVAGELEKNTGQSLGKIFRSCAQTYLGGLKLEREERELFFSLGEHLGYLDREMQLGQLALQEQELERILSGFLRELPEKKKIYRSLGIMGGVLLAVLVW